MVRFGLPHVQVDVLSSIAAVADSLIGSVERPRSYWVRDYLWTILRGDFASLNLYAYASMWANLIFYTPSESNNGAQTLDRPQYIRDASCRQDIDLRGRLLFTFTHIGSIPPVFKKGARFILSLTDPTVDGYKKFPMSISEVTDRSIIVVDPDAYPSNLFETVWRIDALQDTERADRLLDALRILHQSCLRIAILARTCLWPSWWSRWSPSTQWPIHISGHWSIPACTSRIFHKSPVTHGPLTWIDFTTRVSSIHSNWISEITLRIYNTHRLDDDCATNAVICSCGTEAFTRRPSCNLLSITIVVVVPVVSRQQGFRPESPSLWNKPLAFWSFSKCLL